jgi:hypothetical protein
VSNSFYINCVKPFKKEELFGSRKESGGTGGIIYIVCVVVCCLLSGCVETVGCEDMVVHTSVISGMRTTKKKVTEPSNNDVLKVGRNRSMGILM